MGLFSTIKSTLKYMGSGFLRTDTAYDGAKTDRRLKNWKTSSGSPDGEIIYDLDTLRERSRDLYKNNTIGKGAIDILSNNVVGRGLRMQCAMNREVISKHNGWDKKEEADFFNNFENTMERKFDWWANSKQADSNDQLSFYSLQKLAYDSVLQSGEVFATMPLRKHTVAPYRLRCGLIEADQVRSPHGMAVGRNNRDGIVTTDTGRALAYWVNSNQEVYPYEYKLIPKYGRKSGRPLILHLYRPTRPGQSRGMPFLTPVMSTLKNIGTLKDATLDKAIVESFFAAFIISEKPDALKTNSLGDKPQSESDAEFNGDDYAMGPGTITQLEPGEDIKFGVASNTSIVYKDMFESFVKEVGMALNIPYESLVQQFNSSYTASKAARVELGKKIGIDRVWIVDSFCKPFYEEFFIEEVLSGRIEAPGFFDSYDMMMSYLGSVWSGEAMAMIAPEREVKAANDKVMYGFSTATREAAEMNGTDYQSNIIIQQREKKLRQELGIVNSPDIEPLLNEKKKENKNDDDE